MLRNIAFLLIFIIVANCGFTPLYNIKNFKDINITIIDFQGDNEINELIDFYSRKKNENTAKNQFNIKVKSTSEKKILLKDKSGTAQQYELLFNILFIIAKEDYLKDLNISESYNIQNLEDQYDEENYIKNLKENFVKKALERLRLELSLL